MRPVTSADVLRIMSQPREAFGHRGPTEDPDSMSNITTQDGTCIIIHPVVGQVSAATYAEAEAEIRKRLAYRNVRADARVWERKDTKRNRA